MGFVICPSLPVNVTSPPKRLWCVGVAVTWARTRRRLVSITWVLCCQLKFRIVWSVDWRAIKATQFPRLRHTPLIDLLYIILAPCYRLSPRSLRLHSNKQQTRRRFKTNRDPRCCCVSALCLPPTLVCNFRTYSVDPKGRGPDRPLLGPGFLHTLFLPRDAMQARP